MDTLAIFAIPPAFVIRRGNSSYQSGQPFSPSPLVRIAPRGEYLYLLEFPIPVGDREVALRVTKLDAESDTVYSRIHSFPAMPIPQAVRDSVYEAISAVLRQGNPPPFTTAAAMREAQNAASIPDVYPAADAAFADEDGRLWVRTAVNRDGTANWVVLGVSGERIARAVTPVAASLRTARGSSAWGVELDEFDVPHIIRYRISSTPD
jgi:hypothetical protein